MDRPRTPEDAINLADQINRDMARSKDGTTPVAMDAYSTHLARTLSLKHGLDTGDLRELSASDPDKYAVVAMLPSLLAQEGQTIVNHQVLADKVLSVLASALHARTVALAVLKDQELVPVLCRRGDNTISQSEIVTTLMFEAVTSGRAVAQEIRTDAAAKPGFTTVPAVAVPLKAGQAIVGVFYLDRPAGTASFSPDLPYLRTIAGTVSSHIGAAELIRRQQEEIEEARQQAEAAKRESAELRRESEDLRRALDEKHRGMFPRLEGGVSPVFRPVFTRMYRAATAPVEVLPVILLLGPPGSGKTTAAREMHYLDVPENKRRGGPFITVAVPTIKEDTLVSELFGHVKGSFTGAVQSKAGLFEEAQGGTLFLDEIGELPLKEQAMLLRAIERREARRLGANESYRVDVRIIAATNRDLEQMVKDGTFRQDLYYRLNRYVITFPTLMERKADLPLLISAILKRVREELHRPNLQISDPAKLRLLTYEWPGNIRDLENVIQAAAIDAAGDTIEEQHLVIDVMKKAAEEPKIAELPEGGLAHATKAFRREMILRAVAATDGDIPKAAALLKLNHGQYIYQVMARLGLRSKDVKEEALRMLGRKTRPAKPRKH